MFNLEVRSAIIGCIRKFESSRGEEFDNWKELESSFIEVLSAALARIVFLTQGTAASRERVVRLPVLSEKEIIEKIVLDSLLVLEETGLLLSEGLSGYYALAQSISGVIIDKNWTSAADYPA